MNLFRFALPAALALALSVNVFADDDEDMAPRNGTGTITIITDPPNSDVFLDGDSLGKSPIVKRKFRSGPLRLIVIDQGKELINTRFNVWPNKENKFEGKTTMPAGGIVVTTNPNKCRILLDGEIADRTDGGPLTISSVDAGSHTIGAEGCGKLFEILIPIRGEQTTEVYLDVKARKGTAKIDGEIVTGKDK
ncbi:MAG: PEGA domain-containing protein [Fibromonadales bacterium]|nr:PEGA domain-containing protein [Fibromonadales bacterium]